MLLSHALRRPWMQGCWSWGQKNILNNNNFKIYVMRKRHLTNGKCCAAL